jgi:hypothetical protein
VVAEVATVPSLVSATVAAKETPAPTSAGTPVTAAARFASGGRETSTGPSTVALLFSRCSVTDAFTSLCTMNQYWPSGSAFDSGIVPVTVRVTDPPAAIGEPPVPPRATGWSFADGVASVEIVTRFVHTVEAATLPVFDSVKVNVACEPKVSGLVAVASAEGTRSGAGVGSSSNGALTTMLSVSFVSEICELMSECTRRNRVPPSYAVGRVTAALRSYAAPVATLPENCWRRSDRSSADRTASVER